MADVIKNALTYAGLRTGLANGDYIVGQSVFVEAAQLAGYRRGSGFFQVVSASGLEDDGKDIFIGGSLAAVRHSGVGYDVPLDTLFDSIAAAFSSARLLVTDYAGSPLIRVRRSSDNAESNIGHDANGDLDATALATFVGEDTAYLTVIYDQSRYARHARQTTTGRQPVLTAGAMVFDGTDDRLLIDQSPQNSTATYVSSATLPDGAQRSTAGKGWTCTGLTYDATVGCFWVGNHGEAFSGEGSNEPSVVQLSLDGQTILSEIDISALDGTITSVQGVTVDTSDESLWVACPNQSKLLHISKAGALLATVSVTSINGVAYDPANDNLICLQSNALYVRNKAGSLVRSYPSTGYSATDHLCFDATNRILYMTWDDGDGYANLALYDHDSRSQYATIGPFAENEANEGIAVIGTSLYMTADMYYHSAGSLLNQLLRYSIPAVITPQSVNAASYRPVVAMIGKGTATQNLIHGALWSIADPFNDGQGAGVFALNTGSAVLNQLRISSNGEVGTTGRTNTDETITGENGTSNLAWVSAEFDCSENETVLTVADEVFVNAAAFTKDRMPLIASSEIACDSSTTTRPTAATIHEIVFFADPSPTALAAYKTEAEAEYGL